MRIFFLFVAFFLLPTSSYATPQIPDTVKYNDLVLSWIGEGLTPILQDRNIEFAIRHTASYDGHIAKWEIRNKKLFLVDLVAWIKEKEIGTSKIKEVGLEFLFPDSNAVFADWFTGEMILLEYERKMNEALIVECTYWVIAVESGRITRSVRKIEKFNFQYNEQLKRYVTLFRKFPRR